MEAGELTGCGIRNQKNTEHLPSKKSRSQENVQTRELSNCSDQAIPEYLSSIPKASASNNSNVSVLSLNNINLSNPIDEVCQTILFQLEEGMTAKQVIAASNELMNCFRCQGATSYRDVKGESHLVFNLVEQMFTGEKLQAVAQQGRVQTALGTLRYTLAELDSVLIELCDIETLLTEASDAVRILHDWLGQQQARRLRLAKKTLNWTDYQDDSVTYTKALMKKLRLSDFYQGIDGEDLASAVPTWFEKPTTLRCECSGQLSELLEVYNNLASAVKKNRKKIRAIKKHPKKALDEETWREVLSAATRETGKLKEALKSLLHHLVRASIADMTRRECLSKNEQEGKLLVWNSIRLSSRSNSVNWRVIQTFLVQLISHLPNSKASNQKIKLKKDTNGSSRLVITDKRSSFQSILKRQP